MKKIKLNCILRKHMNKNENSIFFGKTIKFNFIGTKLCHLLLLSQANPKFCAIPDKDHNNMRRSKGIFFFFSRQVGSPRIPSPRWLVLVLYITPHNPAPRTRGQSSNGLREVESESVQAQLGKIILNVLLSLMILSLNVFQVQN